MCFFLSILTIQNLQIMKTKYSNRQIEKNYICLCVRNPYIKMAPVSISNGTFHSFRGLGGRFKRVLPLCTATSTG